MFKYKVFKNDKFIVQFDCPIKALAYEIAIDYGKMEHEKALECADLAYQTYLKDDNETPIGNLFDYIVNKYDEIIEENLSRTDILERFYE